ncbi:SIR2 family NAD-dependent protein deacylase [Paractinoplanes globisporus]|uniref:NAD-dependent protein deacylase n=1 Tax=Paractinoplanes globisporus TaxID=113565 RepID=A0ABW6WMB7_9ACTN|nr:NAD-dependent deacylase [Actinoplanes globisporus]
MPERDVAELLRDAKRVVVFTGAGMSAESGVPTFRDALTGLWSRFDPKSLATPEAFAADPALVWGWYEWRRAEVERVRPNPGHEAVAAIEAHVADTVVITQNVDDLHERAGSRGPIHLHGSLFSPRCSSCGKPAGLPAPGEVGGRMEPPACAHCGAPVRPGVVWFGEQLPTSALSAATEAAFGCDLLFTVGTSGVVYPAAEIPYVAARSGAVVVQVNPEATALDAVSDINLRGTAAEVLPDLVDRAWSGR